MARVDLTDQEWQQVMTLLADGPWRVSNPLLMKIGAQLQAQASTSPQPVNVKPGNGEVHHE